VHWPRANRVPASYKQWLALQWSIAMKGLTRYAVHYSMICHRPSENVGKVPKAARAGPIRRELLTSYQTWQNACDALIICPLVTILTMHDSHERTDQICKCVTAWSATDRVRNVGKVPEAARAWPIGGLAAVNATNICLLVSDSIDLAGIVRYICAMGYDLARPSEKCWTVPRPLELGQ